MARSFPGIHRTDRFLALIQADLVSIMDRPHSNRTGRPHRAPSFKWIGSASSCRALNHAGPPRPHSSDLIAPQSVRPHSKDLADPRFQRALIQGFRSPRARPRPQSSNQAARTLAPSFKPFRSRPINAHIQDSGLRSTPRSL
jgi:hypothetical protein